LFYLHIFDSQDGLYNQPKKP